MSWAWHFHVIARGLERRCAIIGDKQAPQRSRLSSDVAANSTREVGLKLLPMSAFLTNAGICCARSTTTQFTTSHHRCSTHRHDTLFMPDVFTERQTNIRSGIDGFLRGHHPGPSVVIITQCLTGPGQRPFLSHHKHAQRLLIRRGTTATSMTSPVFT